VNTAAILKLVLLLGVVLLVVAIGARARPAQTLLLLRRPALALPAMVAMYVLLPAFVLTLVRVLPLQPGVGAVLLGFAVAPVLPPWARKGTAVGGQSDYVIGLQVLSSVVALLVIPVMVEIVRRLFAVETTLEPLAVELVLLITVAAPLALGMVLARLHPAGVPRLATLADRAGGMLLLLGAAILLLFRGPAILAVIGGGTLVLTIVVVAFGLLVGHLLGGPDPGNRGALASATVSRHPAIALLLASGSGKGSEAGVIGLVLLYMVVALVLTIPYERWRRRAARQA
jgi:BASS family bile acid:Na+ symporter